MNKETLLERCQREAREKFRKEFVRNEMLDLVPIANGKDYDDFFKKIIANTLKQAAESLEGIKQKYYPPDGDFRPDTTELFNQGVTDAQKVLLGELDK